MNRHFLHPFLRTYECLKRVSFRLSVKLCGSVSTEAAIAIPVFLFCFLEIISLLNYLSVYGGVLYAIKQAAEPVAIYAYAYEDCIKTGEDISLGEEVITGLLFSEGYLDAKIRKQCNGSLYENTIKGGTQGIQLLGSRINRKNECLDIVAHYTVKPIVDFAGTEMLLTNRYYVKLWTGYTAEKSSDGEAYVYVTENGKVYHLSDTCSYLRLRIRKADADRIEAERNASGGKYLPCSLCEEEKAGAYYYVTEYGEHYHKSLSCSGLKRTVRCVTREEAGDMPACKKCSKEEGDKP